MTKLAMCMQSSKSIDNSLTKLRGWDIDTTLPTLLKREGVENTTWARGLSFADFNALYSHDNAKRNLCLYRHELWTTQTGNLRPYSRFAVQIIAVHCLWFSAKKIQCFYLFYDSFLGVKQEPFLTTWLPLLMFLYWMALMVDKLLSHIFKLLSLP